MTNVAGLGAVQLAESLLPALEADPQLSVHRIFMPDRGPLAAYVRRTPGPVPLATTRLLPNALSRLVECTVGGRRFDGDAVLLVLGDLPLRTSARQLLFVQTPHMLSSLSTASGRDAAKFAVMRAVFRANASCVAGFIVQSVVMRDALIDEYRLDPARVHIVQQPPPEWLRGVSNFAPAPRTAGDRLRLFYPAANYPHKNHALLAQMRESDWAAIVARLTLTIDPGRLPAALKYDCVGRLGPAAMMRQYSQSDALLFLSTAESYGFPLVEAMWLGLPVVVADRGYAHALCGEQALYFDDADLGSLVCALTHLRDRLDAGWRPEWREQLAKLPGDWREVAATIASIALE